MYILSSTKKRLLRSKQSLVIWIVCKECEHQTKDKSKKA